MPDNFSVCMDLKKKKWHSSAAAKTLSQLGCIYSTSSVLSFYWFPNQSWIQIIWNSLAWKLLKQQISWLTWQTDKKETKSNSLPTELVKIVSVILLPSSLCHASPADEDGPSWGPRQPLCRWEPSGSLVGACWTWEGPGWETQLGFSVTWWQTSSCNQVLTWLSCCIRIWSLK